VPAGDRAHGVLIVAQVRSSDRKDGTSAGYIRSEVEQFQKGTCAPVPSGFIGVLALTPNSELLYVSVRSPFPGVAREIAGRERMNFPPVHIWQTGPNRLQYGRVLAQELHFKNSRRNSQ
jgi:hypothetical protein